MPLHPEVEAFLKALHKAGAMNMETVTPDEMRGLFEKMPLNYKDAPTEFLEVHEKNIPGPLREITLWIYKPPGNGSFPVLCYFHGGGFVCGNLKTHDPVCRLLALQTPCIVVAVEYSLAPEYKFPVAPEDCYAAIEWVSQNAEILYGDKERVTVGGDSAGGNLAAVVSLMARDRNGPSLNSQLLVHPVTIMISSTHSYEEYGEVYFITKEMIAWFNDHYLEGQDDKNHPYASPLLASDLGNLPPAFILTGEYDPLRDEGEIYATRLQQAGNNAVLFRVMGHVHPFFLPGFTAGKLAISTSAAALRMAFTR